MTGVPSGAPISIPFLTTPAGRVPAAAKPDVTRPVTGQSSAPRNDAIGMVTRFDRASRREVCDLCLQALCGHVELARQLCVQIPPLRRSA